MKRQNKNSKKIASAASMLLLSTAMLGMATYAWFTMNKEVSVTNMQVKARTDQGLLINEVSTANDSHWDNEATTNQGTGIELHATSTANTAAWYCAYSKKANSAASAEQGAPSGDLSGTYHLLGSTGYTTATETISASAGTTAEQNITYIDKGTSGYQNGEGYYVKYTYYLKSSGDAITCSTSANGQSLNIQDLSVTANSGTATSAALDKALRVAVVANNKAYIFAPLHNDADPYYVNASSTATSVLDSTASQPTAITSIPDVTAAGTPVDVYLYFEGEDPELKTSNVTNTLDNLTVEFRFALVDNASAVVDNGVAVSNQ